MRHIEALKFLIYHTADDTDELNGRQSNLGHDRIKRACVLFAMSPKMSLPLLLTRV